MDSFKVNNYGATINGTSNADGTYTVTTKTTGLTGPQKKTVEVLTNDEVKEKFGNKVDLKNDTFVKNPMIGNDTLKVTDYLLKKEAEKYEKYSPYNIFSHYAMSLQAFLNGDKETALKIFMDTPNPASINNPYNNAALL